MERIPERRFFRLLVASVFLGVSLAVVVVGRLTMRSVGLEWGVPSFGFPFAAYGYTGTSSGERWIAVVPHCMQLTAPVAACSAECSRQHRLHPLAQ